MKWYWIQWNVKTSQCSSWLNLRPYWGYWGNKFHCFFWSLSLKCFLLFFCRYWWLWSQKWHIFAGRGRFLDGVWLLWTTWHMCWWCQLIFLSVWPRVEWNQVWNWYVKNVRNVYLEFTRKLCSLYHLSGSGMQDPGGCLLSVDILLIAKKVDQSDVGSWLLCHTLSPTNLLGPTNY